MCQSELILELSLFDEKAKWSSWRWEEEVTPKLNFVENVRSTSTYYRMSNNTQKQVRETDKDRERCQKRMEERERERKEQNGKTSETNSNERDEKNIRLKIVNDKNRKEEEGEKRSKLKVVLNTITDTFCFSFSNDWSKRKIYRRLKLVSFVIYISSLIIRLNEIEVIDETNTVHSAIPRCSHPVNSLFLFLSLSPPFFLSFNHKWISVIISCRLFSSSFLKFCFSFVFLDERLIDDLLLSIFSMSRERKKWQKKSLMRFFSEMSVCSVCLTR